MSVKHFLSLSEHVKVELRKERQVGDHDEDDSQPEVEREVEGVGKLHKEQLGLRNPERKVITFYI
jgi:hypothetical protein